MNILGTVFGFNFCLIEAFMTSSCGIDNSPVNVVYEGQATIETYPWLGILYYPKKNKRFTTAVVLVTRQIVLAAATEIDRLPKADFRARARVVLGHNCSGPSLTIRDYTYHPDYSSNRFSALTMIQLETDLSNLYLRPICPPPSYFNNPSFFAMVLSSDCKKSRITIHKMQYISSRACKAFYRRTNLDVESLWPTHTACARSMSGGRCIWRSGAILVTKTGRQWRLLGFGVYGPGCEAPSRFLDYGMYYKWVVRGVSRIGRPSITTMADNHVVMRRMSANIQRFGPCDKEEEMRELYSDTSFIKAGRFTTGDFSYNVSLYANVEYSCITFKADYTKSEMKETPKVRLQRWCSGSRGICFGFGLLSIHFHLTVNFKEQFKFTLRAYGEPAKLVDPLNAIEYLNSKSKRPKVFTYPALQERNKDKKYGKYVYRS